MPKHIRYIGIIILILIAIFAIFKLTNNIKNLKQEETKVESKVFEDPETIVYQIKGKENFRLTKEDEEYKQILEKLNSSILGEYKSREELRNSGEKLLLDIINIQEEIYSKYSVLKLIYNENYEINVILDNNDVLDIIYVENNKYDSYSTFKEGVKKEIKQYIDNVL